MFDVRGWRLGGAALEARPAQEACEGTRPGCPRRGLPPPSYAGGLRILLFSRTFVRPPSVNRPPFPNVHDPHVTPVLMTDPWVSPSDDLLSRDGDEEGGADAGG